MFFPPGTFGDADRDNAFIAAWYETPLTTMQEPVLWEMTENLQAHIYRFLWLPSFHAPFAARLSIEADGTGALNIKRTDSKVQAKVYLLTMPQVRQWLERLNQAGYWKLPTQDDTIGLDGARWILEGVRDGKYHVVDRWSPDSGAFREAILLLLGWADVSLNNLY